MKLNKETSRKYMYSMLLMKQQQGQYINMFKEQEMDAIYLTHQIDTTFITHLEQRNPEVKFLRIDSRTYG